MNSSGIKNAKLTNYWLEFYTNEGHCSLCANSGVVDTTGLKTLRGMEVGRKNFCICPNGQAIRKNTINEAGNRQQLPE